MLLLAIDQGNTRTKFGLFHDGALLRAWATATQKTATAAELRSAAFAHPDLPAGIPVGLCTVVPELLPAWRQSAEDAAFSLTIFTGESPTPLCNAYATPATLGPDRLLTAVAAAHRVGMPVLPVSLGTATVVDAVSADGAYLGGMIAPGIGVTTAGLFSATSALPDTAWRVPAQPIGRTTDDAIAAGMFYAAVGGVQAMIRAVRDALGTAAPLALTGGWAAQVAPHLDDVALVDAHLTLHGIAITLADR